MKKLTILFTGLLTIMVLSQCSKPSIGILMNNAETRGKIISELVNNDGYMTEVMDSMMHSNHGMKMMSQNHNMMKMMMSDSSMKHKMMNREGMNKSHVDGVSMMNGKMMMQQDGKMTLMSHDMTMTNGTKVMMNGTCINRDGTQTMFKDGEYMDMSGKMMMK